MKIIKNTSHFDTKKLNSLFCLIHNQLAKFEGRLPHWSELKIQVANRNGTSRLTSGRAFVGKRRTYLAFGQSSISMVHTKGWDVYLSLAKEASVKDIANVFSHELMHSYGYNHHQFKKYPLLEENHIEIQTKFDKAEMLKPIHVPKKRISYKQKCEDLMKEFDWLVIERHNIEHLREIEVYDSRDDCLCYEDNSIKCTCDSVFDMRMNWRAENMNWKKAYENAMLHILGENKL